MPALRARRSNSKKFALSKNSCETRKSAPASTFCLRGSRSSSVVARLGMLLRIARRADAEVVVAPQHRDQLVGVREAAGRSARTAVPAGGSPRSASTFSIPARAKSSKSARSSARVGADARDVRDDRQADLLLDLLGERDGSRARRSAGAVGDRNERRAQGRAAPRSSQTAGASRRRLWAERTRTRRTAAASQARR